MTAAAIVISSLAARVALGIAVGVAHTKASRRDAWRRLAASRRERSASTGETYVGGGYDTLDRYWATSRNTRRSTLLLKLAEIETAAADLLDERLGHHEWQLFEIRSELRRLGVWSDSDVVKFDQAMNLRNEVVHGSDSSVSGPTNRVSDDDLEVLLAKVIGDKRNTYAG